METRLQMIQSLQSTFKQKIGWHTYGYIECYKISAPRLKLLQDILNREEVRERMSRHEQSVDKQQGT